MNSRTIPYSRPALEADEIQAVVECLRSGWITTGAKTKEFEAAFCLATGAKTAVALNSCTAGLHLGLAAFGVGPGDEVIVPSLTFVAGAQCVRHLGAIPVFADVDPGTLCVTATTIERVMTPRTKVIMPMQYGGAPIDIGGIVDLAHARGIRVLEDAAHALGTLDAAGRSAGSISDAACYSFYATKNITTAEGGMFVTNDPNLADTIRILSLHGMDKDAWKRYTLGSKYEYDVISVGYKYNMPDVLAAMGIVQLSKLVDLQRRRDQIARYYLDALESIPGIRPATTWHEAPSRHSWCVFALIVQDGFGLTRHEIVQALLRRGIGTSVHFPPTHRLSAFLETTPVSLPVSEWAAERLISLPLYPTMSMDDAAYVMSALKSTMAAGVTQSAPKTATPS